MERPSSKDLLTGAQLEVLGIAVEIGLKVGDGVAVGIVVADAETAAHVDVLHFNLFLLEHVLRLIDAVAEVHKVSHLKNLTADMEMETDEVDVWQ